jgi:hypothetical protein
VICNISYDFICREEKGERGGREENVRVGCLLSYCLSTTAISTLIPFQKEILGENDSSIFP